MTYPQEPAEKPLYMHLQRGYHHQGISKDTHVLKLVCNIYGQKQGGHPGNQYLDEGMNGVGFSASEYNPCLYYRQMSSCQYTLMTALCSAWILKLLT